MAGQAQQLLVKPTPEQIAKLREQLSGLVGAYIQLEDEKKDVDADYNARLSEIWDEVRGLRAHIKEAEEAIGDVEEKILAGLSHDRE